METYSQFGQDKFLDTHVFKNFRDGTYVDVGAYDGIKFSNTYLFAKQYGWHGINIEPNSIIFADLQKNRPDSINMQIAIDVEDNKHKDFMLNTGYSKMLSGLKEYYDSKHIARLNKEQKQYGGLTTIVPVTTRRLDSLLLENNISHIHLLSIDVEGAEESVIKSIDFDKVFIDVIIFENNYDNAENIKYYLRNKGYIVFKKAGDIYMIHKKSQFMN